MFFLCGASEVYFNENYLTWKFLAAMIALKNVKGIIYLSVNICSVKYNLM